MFRLIEPSSGQIQNIVLVHSVFVHWMYQFYVLYLAWLWLIEPKHVAEFLILITNKCCVIDWINYYIIAKHNGMAPIKQNCTSVYFSPNIFGLWTGVHKILDWILVGIL